MYHFICLVISYFSVKYNSSPLPELIAIIAEQKEQVSISMVIQNVEFMHKYCLQHLIVGTLIIKLNKVTEEGGTLKSMNMERCRVGMMIIIIISSF